jgi:hypothetical protein
MTKDSDKTPSDNVHETHRDYQREDLIWEAVRRNEEYKKAYGTVLKE